MIYCTDFLIQMNTDGIIGHTKQIDGLRLLLENGKIPQTMLFSGISGIGKRKIALRVLASFFCSSNNAPCLTCRTCRQISGGSYPDLLQLNPDEKGHIPVGSPEKREEGSVRWLIDRLSKKSVSEKFGVIVNCIENVSLSGQTALLKTIEEPPHNAKIILLTANKSLILPTIISRCTEISFLPLSEAEVEYIIKNINVDPEEPELISKISGGSAELALFLSEKERFNELIELCRDISDHINNNSYLKLDLSLLQKNAGIENAVTMILNIYRIIFISKIYGYDLKGVLNEIVIDNNVKLKKVIKIFLAVRKGFANNLNIRNSLKGLLYSIDSIDEIGLPSPDFRFVRQKELLII